MSFPSVTVKWSIRAIRTSGEWWYFSVGAGSRPWDKGGRGCQSSIPLDSGGGGGGVSKNNFFRSVKSHLLRGVNSYTLYSTTVGLVQRLSRNMSFNTWLRELLDRVDGFVGRENTITKRNLKEYLFLLTYSLPSLKSSKTFTKRFTLSIFLTFPEEKCL